MDRGACWAIVHGVAKSRTRLKRLSTQHKESVMILERTQKVYLARTLFQEAPSGGPPPK